MVFGDNVRARRAARALPRTPTAKEKKKKEEEDKTSNENYTPITPPPFHNPQHNATRQDMHCHHTLPSQHTLLRRTPQH